MELYKAHVEKSFQNAHNNISKITNDIVNYFYHCKFLP